MPWTNQSGGGGPWGGGQSPWGRPQGPKVEDIIKRSQDKLRGVLPGGFGSMPGFLIILVIAFFLWAASGIYQVQPDELGVVLRFGAFNGVTSPGLRYR
jgi:modulator of FtsH protease HflK